VIIEIDKTNNACANTVAVQPPPSITVLKSAVPAAVKPGQVITYTIQNVNSGGPGTNVVMRDDMSPYTAICLTCYTCSGSPCPFGFTEGSPASGLSFGTLQYSSDNGSTWGYTPVSGGGGAPSGYDGKITNWQILMTGGINANGGFTLNYQAIVK